MNKLGETRAHDGTAGGVETARAPAVKMRWKSSMGFHRGRRRSGGKDAKIKGNPSGGRGLEKEVKRPQTHLCRTLSPKHLHPNLLITGTKLSGKRLLL